MELWNYFTHCRKNESRRSFIVMGLALASLAFAACVAGPTPHPSQTDDENLYEAGNQSPTDDSEAAQDVSLGSGPGMDSCGDALTVDACPSPPGLDADVGPDAGDTSLDTAADTATDLGQDSDGDTTRQATRATSPSATAAKTTAP